MRAVDAINATEAQYEGIGQLELEEHGLDLRINEEDLWDE